jgi:hypothetical protein
MPPFCRSVWTAISILGLALLMIEGSFGDVMRDIVDVSEIKYNQNLCGFSSAVTPNHSTSSYSTFNLISGLVADGVRCYGGAEYQCAFREGKCYQPAVGTYQNIFLPRFLLYQFRLISVQVDYIRLALVNNDLFAVADVISPMCSYLNIDYQFISLNKPRSEFAKMFLKGIDVYFSVALVTDGSYQDCASEWGECLVEEAKTKDSYVSSSAVSTPFNLTEQRRDSVKLDVSARDFVLVKESLTIKRMLAT